jgi:hypothetical protein
MEAAAKTLIWVLALFFSLIPPFLFVALNENPQTNPLWLFLGWWAPFAVPVLALGIVFLRHRDIEHGSDVEDTFR